MLRLALALTLLTPNSGTSDRKLAEVGENTSAPAETPSGKAANIIWSQQPPRFTWEGCPCLQSWQLLGHEGGEVADYCANPDGDAGGDWCFVMDACPSGGNWGYCAPPPRCVVGSQVQARGDDGRPQAALVLAFQGARVALRWSRGGTGTAEVATITTASGLPCLHTRGAVQQETTEAAGVSTSTTVEEGGTSASASVRPEASSLAFDPHVHGPALAMRLDWDYADVVVQQSTFEQVLEHAVGGAVQQPLECIRVLKVMSGSVIAAVSVVPMACAGGGPTTACRDGLAKVRQLWAAALADPESLPRRLFRGLDPSFPAVLTYDECVARSLPCTWLNHVGYVPKSYEPVCGPGTSDERCAKTEDSQFYQRLPILLAFACAMPFCFSICLAVYKAILYLLRWTRRQQYLQEMHTEVWSLARVGELELKEDWACSICLSEQTAGTDLLLLPCKHVLHYPCMLEWFQRRQETCPMCRTSVRLRDCSLCTMPCVADRKIGLEPDEGSPSSAKASQLVVCAPTLPNAVADDEPV